MSLDRRDPEYQANKADLHWRLDAAFLRGAIGEATYIRSLTFMGYTPKDARVELELLKMSVTPDYEERRLQASREWLNSR